jgi:hypothetical protein
VKVQSQQQSRHYPTFNAIPKVKHLGIHNQASDKVIQKYAYIYSNQQGS